MHTARTVLGPVAIEALGRVLPHEHLLSLLPLTDGPDCRVDAAVAALAGLKERGYGTIVDLSPYNVVGRDADGSNVTVLRDISERTGMHVITGTALYLESYAPQWSRSLSETELARRFVRDATIGIGATGIRAGIYGEQATSLGDITDYEMRALRAMATAQQETGLAILTHTTHGTMARQQLATLDEAGADLTRVVIGHMDTHLDHAMVRELVADGVSVAIDTIGKQTWQFFLGPPDAARREGEFSQQAFYRSDTGRADLVADLVARGYADQILLAHDLTGAEMWMNPDTHGRYAYRYLHDIYVPMLQERGVPMDAIDRMTITNPARLLAVPQ